VPSTSSLCVSILCLVVTTLGFCQSPTLVPPTSRTVDESRLSLLVGDRIDTGIPGRPVSNFRLFLEYTSESPLELRLAGHPVILPEGVKATADVTFEHVPDAPATIHFQRDGDLEPMRVEVPDTTISRGGATREVRPGRDFPMNGAFTLVARFHTTSKRGTLASRAPAEGEWKPNGKTLFLRGGVLTYDIGWVGAMRGGPNLADGEEHIAVLAVNGEGHADLFVDGVFVAEKADFTSRDDPGHVFKIGSTAIDFAGDFRDGEIHQVLYWKRRLGDEEIERVGLGQASEVNTPDFHWQPGAAGKEPAAERELTQFGAVPGFPTDIVLEPSGDITFHQAWIQPLEESNHAELVSGWDADSRERGEAIYAQLCVTCHGTPAQEGSIPLSLKFHDPEAAFRNGSDPFRMWQTLTKGYGLMTPMPQYSTRQKYDVIHYIREEFLARSNPGQLFEIDAAYLTALPRGMTVVEEEEAAERPPQYRLMDFGNVLFGTYQVEPGPIDESVNIAQKGIAIRLDPGPGGISQGKAWAIYDHDTMRLAAFYTGSDFVDWKGIDFDGSHGTHRSIVGDVVLMNPDQPGWAHPETGEWEAPRVVGKDGRAFGPIPRDWARYRGIHLTAAGPVLEYTVGNTRVLEEPFVSFPEQEGERPHLHRRLHIDESNRHHLELRVGVNSKTFVAGDGSGPRLDTMSSVPEQWTVLVDPDPPVFRPLPPPTPVTTQIERGSDDGPFAVDSLTVPDADANPHQSWMRTSGFDFYPDGTRAAVCTWMGDVWIVEGIDRDDGELTWKRICSGLFQPLGLKIVDGLIHVTCRDQLARLHDTNGDETIDFIECVNNDHQVTEHFHEFAMGLQVDEAGNFYYAKSARHALDSLVPHHGTLLRVSPDGERTDILATGFRAANGVCLNPDGTFIVTDQEGHWNPKNRINWVNGEGPGEFFGNIYGYSPVTDTSDAAMKDPLCWITNAFDRSPSELLWVPDGAAWGDLNGSLLNLSYGYGKIHIVPHEEVNGRKQGGLCELPVPPFPTGVMRGRFHPGNGQLYACGMFAWAGTQRQAGGFYRIRRTERPAFVPTKLNVTGTGISFRLSDPVEADSVTPENFIVEAWDLNRTRNYGSKHLNQRRWRVEAARLGDEGRTIALDIPDLEPTWGMSIEMFLRTPDGDEVERVIHNSVFELP